MKPGNILSIVLFPLLMLSLQHCKEDPVKPKTELEKLPPATQEGNYTFGCLLNGKAWRTAVANYPYYVRSTYIDGRLNVSGEKHCPYLLTKPCDEQTIVFSLKDLDSNHVLTEGHFDLNDMSKYNPGITFYTIGYNGSINGFCIIDSGDHPNNILSGELEITNFNKSDKIISGLFAFTLVSSCSDTIKVTDGRFDVRYATY